MGTRLHLDKNLAPALAAAGLNNAAGILRLGGDPKATSVVTIVELPVEGTVGKFHLKRYQYAGWATAKGGRPRHALRDRARGARVQEPRLPP
jgi:hypothetical protein